MAISKIMSATNFGMEVLPLEIEAYISNGLPSFTIVGLPDKAVEESKERVRAAIKNSGLFFPDRRITVNLAPADIRKEGPIFDLGIAVSLLTVSEQINNISADSVFLGELSLDGSLRHTKGILPIVHEIAKGGAKEIYLPKKNLAEARIIPGINIYPVENLLEIYRHFKAEKPIKPIRGEAPLASGDSRGDFDMDLVRGQEHAKRALEIAAAGGHNILFSGPPGSGKTMLAKSIVSILPPLDSAEIVEVTKIYSVAGLLSDSTQLITKRPFRSPHHTSSDISLVGGGRVPRPGEITLSHRGVLFLDELPEFSRSVLEVMRQPLEDGEVNVARAAGTVTFPAQFLLVASQNPCPCGYLGDTKHNCTCTPSQIARYQRKVSGPLLDRIDIHLSVPRVEVRKLSSKNRQSTTKEARERVVRAKNIQTERFKNHEIRLNSEMSQRHIEENLNATDAAIEFLANAAEKLDVSARSYFRTLKVARTIADLDFVETVDVPHVAEALQYRNRV